VRCKGKGIAELTALSVREAGEAVRAFAFEPHEAPVADGIVAELLPRFRFLEQVGLDYLALDRGGDTLSGGEARRIRLAAQLGSNLTGVCYILDEPTIGLHPRDNDRLIATLRDLRGRGNSVIVVEHDEETIRASDWIVDLGPGPGPLGGRVRGPGDARGSEEEPRLGHGQLGQRHLAGDHPHGFGPSPGGTVFPSRGRAGTTSRDRPRRPAGDS
jgi:excinuclease ABC subunit A